VQTLSAFLVHELDKKNPLEQFDPQGEQILKSSLTQRLVKASSLSILALKANSSTPQELALQSPGLESSKGGSKSGFKAFTIQQSRRRSSSLIPHVVKSEEAIAMKPFPRGITEEFKSPQHSTSWLSILMPQKWLAPADRDTSRTESSGGSENEPGSPQHFNSPETLKTPHTALRPAAKTAKLSETLETFIPSDLGPQHTSPPSLTSPQVNPSPETTLFTSRFITACLKNE